MSLRLYDAVRAILGSSGAPVFNPLSLFSAAEKGLYIDVSDLSTLYQDSAKTTPVTATSQPVGAILDKTGNHVDFAQATAGKRPTYTVDGSGKSCLAFNGTSNALASTINLAMAGSSAATISFAFVQHNFSLTTQVMFEHGVSGATTAAGGFSGFLNNTTSGGVGAGYGKPSNYQFNNDAVTTSRPVSVITFIIDPSKTVRTDKVRIRVNGAEINELSVLSNGTINSTAFVDQLMYLGARNTGSLYTNADIYQLLIINRLLNDVELANLEADLASKSGATFVSYSDALQATTFNYSKNPVLSSGVYKPSPMSEFTFTTTANLIRIASSTDAFTAFPQYAKLAVYKDGTFLTTLNHSGNLDESLDLDIGAGSKTISIVGGLQTKPASTVLGTYLKSVSANATITQVTDNNSNCLLVYGDSICVGGNSTLPQRDSWFYKTRVQNKIATSGVTKLEAYGYRSLYQDIPDAGTIAAFVSLVQQYAPSKMWIAIGVNDYGLDRWSAASFGAQYAALLDALHTAIPALVIYCQSPIIRSVETANTFGDTLGAYRTQVSTAAAARSGYCTYVDGTTLVSIGNLADGVHPNDTGHTEYFNNVKTVLGI